MSAFNNVIQWYENKALDDPQLRSPTPCPRGVYCQYKLPNPETKELELACCRMVHPGEEGNGRRLFPARTAPDGRQQPACVRLTGKAGFYERCRLKQPWRVWAAEHDIPLPPADIPWVQVQRGPIQRPAKQREQMAGSHLPDYSQVTENRAYKRSRMAAELSEVSRSITAEAAVSAIAQSPALWPPLQMPQPPPRLSFAMRLEEEDMPPLMSACRPSSPLITMSSSTIDELLAEDAARIRPGWCARITEGSRAQIVAARAADFQRRGASPAEALDAAEQSVAREMATDLLHEEGAMEAVD